MSAIWHHDLALPAFWAALAFICGITIAFADMPALCVVALLWISAAFCGSGTRADDGAARAPTLDPSIALKASRSEIRPLPATGREQGRHRHQHAGRAA